MGEYVLIILIAQTIVEETPGLLLESLHRTQIIHGLTLLLPIRQIHGECLDPLFPRTQENLHLLDLQPGKKREPSSQCSIHYRKEITIKPKLIRQSAILADENSTGSGKSVSFINDTPSSKSSSSCPLHHHNPYRGGHLQSNLYGKLIESSHEADDEEDEDLDQRLAEKRKLLRTPSRSLTDLSSTYLRSNPFPDYESPEVKKKSTSSNNTTTSALVEGGMNPAEKEKKPHYPESPTPTESDHLLSKDSSSHTIRTEKGYLNTDV
ncbi:unnamed protein product [Lepeophtheirus salmonis]|uniref:(salmon louse) hypothetical protein n=1 Tax=Lepeophtheirus salmonis TaxID=72036 RepID=A0A7R8H926_LEPSM|nr:unnamed protein product [Lepeophtheirus salmonis]CAF2948178.1 unnamed protein product [Lepeophtheirus salmonis]